MSDMGKPYTTRQAAKGVRIALVTLQRWIADRKVKAPRLAVRHGRAVRLWTERDMSQLRRIKKQVYGKVGRPRKPKA
jgi:predicted site-specific integrase-resolvase